jgi:phospholipase/carboxylesterase
MKICIFSGKKDQTVHHEDPVILKDLFDQRGAQVDLFWLDEGHQLTREELEHAKNWLQKH